MNILLEEAINGYFITIQYPIEDERKTYKQITETKLEALYVIERTIKEEIETEEDNYASC